MSFVGEPLQIEKKLFQQFFFLTNSGKFLGQNGIFFQMAAIL